MGLVLCVHQTFFVTLFFFLSSDYDFSVQYEERRAKHRAKVESSDHLFDSTAHDNRMGIQDHNRSSTDLAFSARKRSSRGASSDIDDQYFLRLRKCVLFVSSLCSSLSFSAPHPALFRLHTPRPRTAPNSFKSSQDTHPHPRTHRHIDPHRSTQQAHTHSHPHPHRNTKIRFVIFFSLLDRESC